MCFSIPYKVVKIAKNKALLEGNKSVKIGSDLKVTEGDYLQVLGDVAVGRLSKMQGLKIRRLIKSLNSYEQKN